VREAVSDILVDRARDADGMTRTVVLSLLAHGLLLTIIYVAPASWRTARVDPEASVMTISIGGAPGPKSGGMTSISAKPVQTLAPPEARPTPIAPPAPKPPEMALPEPKAKPAPKTPPKPVEKPDDKASARKPSTGPQVQEGTARVDTGATAPGFGITTSGGGQGGARVDAPNFCCPDYLVTMNELIRRNWAQNQGVTANVEIRFTIHRNGTITDSVVEKPSRYPHLDREAIRAVAKTRVLPPLPREFPHNTLTVYLIFEYKQ
jgi:TonB family protein